MQRCQRGAIVTGLLASVLFWNAGIDNAFGQIPASIPTLSDINVDLSAGPTGTLRLNGETLRIEPNQTIFGPNGLVITTTATDLSITSPNPIQIDSSTTMILGTGGNITFNSPTFLSTNLPTIGNGGSLGGAGGVITISSPILPLSPPDFTVFPIMPQLVNPGFLAEQQLTNFFAVGYHVLEANLQQLSQGINSPSSLLLIDDDVRLKDADLKDIELGRPPS